VSSIYVEICHLYFDFQSALSPPSSVFFAQNLRHAFYPEYEISGVSLGRKARKRPDAEIGIKELLNPGQ
jgi:hypothetical protein